jgi:PAS domain S-box-containing protein
MRTVKKDQIVSDIKRIKKTKYLSSPGGVEHPDNSIDTESIPVSDALNRSENRFYTLYYQSPIAIEHYDKRGKLIDVNPSFLSLFGVSNLEPLKNSDLFSDPNISEEHKKKLKRKEVVQYQGLFDFEKVRKYKLYPTKKSGKIWIDVRITPLMNNKDNIDGYLVQIIDINDRVIADETIRESEEKYRTLFENVQDVFYKIDMDGIIREISPSIKYLSEFERDELIGQSVLDMYANPKDRLAFLNSLMKYGELTDYEIKLKSKDGKMRYSSINARLITNKRGKPIYITGALRDITERKHTEEALSKSEELFRSVVQNSSDLISLTDDKGILRYISPQCEKVLGFPAEKFIGVAMPDIIHPDDKLKCQNAWVRVYNGEELRDFVYRIIDSQKKVRWISQSSRLIKTNEIAMGIQSTLRDITKQWTAEETLRENEEKYRLLFDNASQAIVVAQGDVLKFVNPKACEIFGYSGEELLTIPFMQFIFDDDKQMIAKNYKNRLQGNPSPQNYPFRILRKDKTIRWLEASVVVFNWMGKNASLNYLTDITDRKKAELELNDTIEQLRQLTNYIEEVRELERLTISRELHDDLGQALTAVIIDLSLIKQKITDQEIARKIEKTSTLVNNTIKSIQRLTSDLRPDMINDLGLNDAIEYYTTEFAERSGIKLSLNIDQGIKFPPNTSLNIFRIIQESLTNIARHAMATKVDFILKRSYDSVCIKISDNGKGVNEDDINSKKSFGIMSMKERALSMGGTFDIYPKTRKGTEIKLILPLSKI